MYTVEELEVMLETAKEARRVEEEVKASEVNTRNAELLKRKAELETELAAIQAELKPAAEEATAPVAQPVSAQPFFG